MYVIRFQYISCYCLSKKRIDILIRDRKFQYISCYCLSTGTTLTKIMEPISIHLMLLFILKTKQFIHRRRYFNTSHVTVYRNRLSRQCLFVHISIHLMLLFIVIAAPNATTTTAFQYISCYCLSNELTPFYIFLRI